ncbi:hypothetical protein TGAM01_v207718 [Trichoderma gamsii]|uniref:Uncharacterized protein n=1 Tax=Trichoderma gamsii TaxID=398673 RepID=A0A2P4ZGQ8_9HYPO|nr:hypothetical protein TGAM01_v207718 [Trichoderma gamsii]PON23484.1 hypothetical protein TGAM01_v207718 [Trichoderma gamsii]
MHADRQSSIKMPAKALPSVWLCANSSYRTQKARLATQLR